MNRKPVVSGTFYESEFGALTDQIEECFINENGPGTLPLKRKPEKMLKAMIVPHAGYAFSGSCAAWAYKELAESHFPKTYVILGFSHSGLQSGISKKDWETPLGIIPCDTGLADEIAEETVLDIDEVPHLNEHSIEVQLPFLQFSCRDRIKELKILPISVGRDISYKALAEQLFEALKGKDAVLIVSSDMTHYGKNYGYVPFTTDVEKRLGELDSKAIRLISGLDISGFAEFLNKTNITICGYYPILLLMAYLKLEPGGIEGRNVSYMTSGKLMDDFSSSVSYAGIVFE